MDSVVATVEHYSRYQSVPLWVSLVTVLIGFVGILLWLRRAPHLQQIAVGLDVDLSTKVFAVTEASSGIGAAITKELYRRNAIVLMLVNNWSNAVEIKADITANISSSGYITIIYINMSSFESIGRCAVMVKRYVTHLDGLFNNVGVEVVCKRKSTENDIAYTQEVNAMGHLALTRLLLPMLIAANGRVVATSSILSKIGESLNVDEISYVRETYADVQIYSRSSLLINIFTAKLAQIYKDTGIRFFSADPGIDIMPLWNVFITFFFSQNCPRLLQMLRSQLYRTVGISPTQAALRVIALGFSPMFDEYNGGHFHNYCFSEVHPMIKEQEKLDDIWNAIEEKLSNGPFYSDRVPSLMDSADMNPDKNEREGAEPLNESELKNVSRKRFISSKNLFAPQKMQ